MKYVTVCLLVLSFLLGTASADVERPTSLSIEGRQLTLRGIGSELALNNRPLAVIEGADFAAAYFGIWLDDRTHYPEFRKELLGLY